MYKLILLAPGLHLLDMLFTILLIRKDAKLYKNPEMGEMNYHRWFFKKFGLYRGALYSLCISFTYLTVLTILLYYYTIIHLNFKSGLLVGLMFGMLGVPVYINYLSWVKYDQILKDRQPYAKGEVKNGSMSE